MKILCKILITILLALNVQIAFCKPIIFYYSDSINFIDSCKGNEETKVMICKEINNALCLIEDYYDTIIQSSINLVNTNDFDARTSYFDNNATVYINYNEVKEYDKIQLRIVLVHEFSHVYELTTTSLSKWSNKLLQHLFLEGSAVFTASLLVPGYNDWQYISHQFKQDSESIGFLKNRDEALKEFKYDCTTDTITSYKKYFQVRYSKTKKWPSRIGYYIGFYIFQFIFQDIGIQYTQISENEFKSYVSLFEFDSK